MKRYIVFSGMQYYPSGGWEDFRGDFDTEEEAYEYLRERKKESDFVDWYEVVDTETKEKVPHREL